MMAFDTADLDAHNGIFALPREEWEETPEFDKLVKDRMAHQEEREQAFLSHKGDCFAIYQVKHTPRPFPHFSADCPAGIREPAQSRSCRSNDRIPCHPA